MSPAHTVGRRVLFLWLVATMLVLVGATHSPSTVTNIVDQSIIHGEDFDPLRHRHRDGGRKPDDGYSATIIASFDTLDSNDSSETRDTVSDTALPPSITTTTKQSPIPRPGNVKNYRYQYVNDGSVVFRSYGNDSTCTGPSLSTTTLPLNICQGSTDVGASGSSMSTLLVSQHRKTKATTWTVITSVYEDADCVQLHHAHVYGQYSFLSTCHLPAKAEADPSQEYLVIDVVRE
eukprot:gene19288-13946_t